MLTEAPNRSKMPVLYRPELKDLLFRKKLLSDPDTMSYNLRYGGTIDFPEERWEPWYEKWLGCSDGSRFYRYLQDGDTFIGEAAYHMEDGRCMADVIILAGYRGRGYGREGLRLLLDAARSNGIEEIFDEIDIDNDAGISLFESQGFSVVSKTENTVVLRKSFKENQK